MDESIDGLSIEVMSSRPRAFRQPVAVLYSKLFEIGCRTHMGSVAIDFLE